MSPSMQKWKQWRYLVWFTGLGMAAIACVLFDTHHLLPGLIVWGVAVAETVSYAITGSVLYRKMQNISGQ